MPSIMVEAETLMKENQFVLLNFDGMVRHLFLHNKPPTTIPIVYQIMVNTNEEGIFDEFRHWDMDDCVDAIALQQVRSMTKVRKLSGNEVDIMIKSVTQVYKRHNIMNPTNQRVIPKDLRSSMAKRCRKFRNIVEAMGGSVVGTETNRSTTRRSEYENQPIQQEKRATDRHQNRKKWSEKNKTTVVNKAVKVQRHKMRTFKDKINRRIKSAAVSSNVFPT